MEKKYNDNIKRNVVGYILSGVFIPALFLAYFFTAIALSFNEADYPDGAMLFGMWVYLFEIIMSGISIILALALGITGIVFLSTCIKNTILKRQIPNLIIVCLNSTLLISFITIFIFNIK